VTALRVLIADDHAMIRSGVRSALEEGGFEVCAEVADGPAAVRAAAASRPDVCLLDVHMPGGGIAAADAITQQVPGVTVVMLTVSRDDADLFAALRAGAAGYLLKDIEPARLPEALHNVLAGDAVLPRGLVTRMIEVFDRRAGPRPGRRDDATRSLSSREWEVLQLMRDGMTTREIADRIGVSPVTVRRHSGEILRKLRVPDRAAAVRLLEERGDGG
jgi:DNA-binding NarL/FixJ family response regulator